jgi:exopolysaccharide biosynthesis polyprenyl glycosylphosphotransferase
VDARCAEQALRARPYELQASSINVTVSQAQSQHDHVQRPRQPTHADLPALSVAWADGPTRAGSRRGRLVRCALLLSDLVGLLGAFAVSQLAFAGGGPEDHVRTVGEIVLFLATLPLWVAAARFYGLYDRDEERTNHSTLDELTGVFHLVTIGTLLLLAAAWLTGAADPNLPKLATFWITAVAAISAARAIARALCRRCPAYVQRALIVGAGEVGRLIAHKLRRHPEYGVQVAGFVDARPAAAGPESPPLLGTLEELPKVIREQGVERVIVAFPENPDATTLQAVRALRHTNVRVDIVPRLFEVLSPRADVHTIEGLPVVGLRPARLSRPARAVKRTADVMLSGAALLVLTPLFAVVAAAIKVDSRGPVLFRQLRMGMGGQPFRIYKFRTMVPDADALKPSLDHLNKHRHRWDGDPRMFKIAGDPRVTRVGAVLRRYSLDELPQLLNVLRGEMSLVGPRPLVLDEDDHVRHWGRRRLNCMPGITGPWQVLGASDIPFEEMLSLDYLYVTEWSLLDDFKWMARTVPAVFRVRDAY